MTNIRYASHLGFIAHKPKRGVCNKSVWQVDSARTVIEAAKERFEVIVLERKRKWNELFVSRNEFSNQTAIGIAKRCARAYQLYDLRHCDRLGLTNETNRRDEGWRRSAPPRTVRVLT